MKEFEIDFNNLLFLMIKKSYVFILYFIVSIIVFLGLSFIVNKRNKDRFFNYAEVYVSDTSYIRTDDLTVKSSISTTDAKILVLSDEVIDKVVEKYNLDKEEFLEELELSHKDYSRVIEFKFKSKEEEYKIIDFLVNNYLDFIKDNFGLDDSFIVRVYSEPLNKEFNLSSYINIKKSILLALLLYSMHILIIHRGKYIKTERSED